MQKFGIKKRRSRNNSATSFPVYNCTLHFSCYTFQFIYKAKQKTIMPPKSAADIRKLLKKQQSERSTKQKVSHPFAKYDEQGRLICIVCNSPVKNETVWQAHLGSQVHRDNIQKLKALKHQQQQQSLKRKAPSPPPISQQKRTRVEEEEDRHDIELDEELEDSSEDEEMGNAALPADFFDSGDNTVDSEEEEKIEEVEEEPVEENGALPAGFFDDPEEEARIQGTLPPEEQAKLDLDRDVEMFNEAMMEVTQETKQVQEEDDETFWLERHDDISRKQALFDSRVEKLKHLRQAGGSIAAVAENKEEKDDDEIVVGLKTSVRQLLKSKPVKQVQSMFDDDEESESEEEEEDWRSQQL